MRAINNLDDVKLVLREVWEFVDRWKTHECVDFNKRRIKNASPSIDDYDYVVRKELKEGGITEVQRAIEQTGLFYEKATFGFGIGGNVVVGTDLTPRYIVENPGTLADIAAIFTGVPTGTTVINLKKNGSTSLFTGTGWSIPVGSGVYRASSVFASSVSLAKDDYITGDVVTANGGTNLVVVLRIKNTSLSI